MTSQHQRGFLSAERHMRYPNQRCGLLTQFYSHTEGTAGLASLISTSQALQHSIIPPNMHFNTLSPRVAPFCTHLEVPTEAKPWPSLIPGQSRRASVNSFGKLNSLYPSGTIC